MSSLGRQLARKKDLDLSLTTLLGFPSSMTELQTQICTYRLHVITRMYTGILLDVSAASLWNRQ